MSSGKELQNDKTEKDINKKDVSVSSEAGISPKKEKQDHSTGPSSSSSVPNTAIKKQMKVVIGSLECILDELKSVVVDLKDVVVQIDDVTSQIEERTSQSNLKVENINDYTEKRASSDTCQLPGRRRQCIRHSLDSGLPDNTSVISSNKSYHQHKSSHCYSSNSHDQGQNSFPVHNSKDKSRWSDNEVVLPCGAKESAIAHKSIAPSCSKKQQPRRRHSHTQCNSSSTSIEKTPMHAYSVTALEKATAFDSETLINNKIEKCRYSRVGKKNKHHSNSAKAPKTADFSSLEYFNTEGTKSAVSSKGIPSEAGSDHCDYYERQLEQQLENIGENCSNNPYKRDNFSTFDGLTRDRKAYSDTLFTMIQGTSRHSQSIGDTAYDSETSDEGVTDDNSEFVIKPSDTFRYKVKQIGMRKMTKVGSCRVVIEP